MEKPVEIVEPKEEKKAPKQVVVKEELIVNEMEIDNNAK